MKVVINKCYGGFNLSDKAIEACIELGMTVGEDKDDDLYRKDFCKGKKRLFGNIYWANHSDDQVFRCDPRVIKVVEQLGDEANGHCSKLRIIDIPFDSYDGWHIEEYDGMEQIAEDHQTWG